MKLTKEFLQEKSASPSGIQWYVENKEPDTVEDCVAKLLADLKQGETLAYANWLLSKTLNTDNCRRYAIFAARQVLHIFEEKYPDDKRPRLAIETAEKYLRTHSEEDRKIADDAAYSVAYSVA